MRYLINIVIAVDQGINALLAGDPDETLSARAWRQRHKPRWAVIGRMIDTIFFWQKDHCKSAYHSEFKRKHLSNQYSQIVKEEK